MSAPLVEEVIVRMMLNGTPSFTWRCTPADLEAMILGRLFVEGHIATAGDVKLSIDRRGDEEYVAAATVKETVSSVSRPSERALTLPEQDAFAELFRQLFHTVEERHESGGMHAAASTDGSRIIRQVEDVGRHNTIDKLVGLTLLDGASFGELGVLTSSRVSGEIAHKAATAGFAWLASRSIPTTLAVRYARDTHMPIIGRAASRNAHVYS